MNHACRLQQRVGEVNDQKKYISLGHFVFIIKMCLPYLGNALGKTGNIKDL